MEMDWLTEQRVTQTKRAYTTRRIGADRMHTIVNDNDAPEAGDLVLARVTNVGQHYRIEQADGRMATLFVDDEIIVAYGNRYAPDQFEAEIPRDLAPCNLVAGGGIASSVITAHGKMSTATAIQPIGFVGDTGGRRLNLRDASLSLIACLRRRPRTVAVVGTSMNAGKTTVAAHLIRGLAQSGATVGAAKVTGTGAGKDLWLMRDAGAATVVDFTDAGVPTTYMLDMSELERIFTTLTNHLANAGADYIVLEVADGLFQRETAQLLDSSLFGEVVDGVLFAACDAMGAVAGTRWLHERGLPVWGVSGMLCSSPLGLQEAAAAVDVPAYDLAALSSAPFSRMAAMATAAAAD